MERVSLYLKSFSNILVQTLVSIILLVHQAVSHILIALSQAVKGFLGYQMLKISCKDGTLVPSSLPQPVTEVQEQQFLQKFANFDSS